MVFWNPKASYNLSQNRYCSDKTVGLMEFDNIMLAQWTVCLFLITIWLKGQFFYRPYCLTAMHWFRGDKSQAFFILLPKRHAEKLGRCLIISPALSYSYTLKAWFALKSYSPLNCSFLSSYSNKNTVVQAVSVLQVIWISICLIVYQNIVIEQQHDVINSILIFTVFLVHVSANNFSSDVQKTNPNINSIHNMTHVHKPTTSKALSEIPPSCRLQKVNWRFSKVALAPANISLWLVRLY